MHFRINGAGVPRIRGLRTWAESGSWRWFQSILPGPDPGAAGAVSTVESTVDSMAQSIAVSIPDSLRDFLGLGGSHVRARCVVVGGRDTGGSPG